MTSKREDGSSLKSRLSNNYLFQAWLCIALALVFGISLAAVQASLGPVIEANKINESKEKVPELLLGGTPSDQRQQLSIVPQTIKVDKGGITKFYSIYEARFQDGRLAGWVTKTGGQGYADYIEVLIGLSPHADKLTGLFILDQKETPGLGNKIGEPGWRAQFNQKPADGKLVVVKGGAQGANQIDAVSGATISSSSVVAIVNNAVADLKKPLAEKSAKEK